MITSVRSLEELSCALNRDSLNDRCWLQADIQPSEIDVCYTLKSGLLAGLGGLPGAISGPVTPRSASGAEMATGGSPASLGESFPQGRLAHGMWRRHDLCYPSWQQGGEIWQKPN